MTESPTPQERTEQTDAIESSADHAAEVAERVRRGCMCEGEEYRCPVHDWARGIDAAVAMLRSVAVQVRALAAESEELRADKERAETENDRLNDLVSKWYERGRTLESRYTALEKELEAAWTDGLDAVDACRHWKCACAIEGKSGARRFLAILSSLTPKEGE